MPKLSLCLETVLTDLDFCDRIKIAADMGFDAFEFWEPEVKDLAKIAGIARGAGIPLSICCIKNVRTTPVNLPASIVLENMRESMKIAKDLGCRSLIALAGDAEGKSDSQKNILIENLKRVADLAVREEVTVNLEALNSLVDHKGYYLDSSYAGFEIIKCVGCERIKFLYDIYHMQIMEGNIIGNITRNVDFIGHLHSAGVPGRHEPHLGENDYHNIINAINNVKYQGYLGLEYWPSYDHRQSLADVRKYFTENCG
ncbi:MAG: hydroxypyruvate isomerase family protein [Bacillota bacterium]